MWGEYEGYYCWAPFGPGAVISPHYRPDPRYWHFVERGHIMDSHIDHYRVKPEEVAGKFHGDVSEINNHISYISHASTYNQSVFFSGPKTEEIQKYTGHPVTKLAVNNSEHAGATHVENNKLNIYRPNIQRTNKQPAPANVKNAPNRNENTPGRTEEPAQRNQQRNQEPAQRNQTHNQQPAPRNEPAQQRNQPAQQHTETWTPPRQSQPQQQPARSQPVERAPERNFIPVERSAPQSAPHYSAPAPSRSGSFGGGGGGARGGGGGRH
jgi:hypothetical protein